MTPSSMVCRAAPWTGTRWTIQNTVDPPDGAILDAMSCATANACTAVGNAYATLAEGYPAPPA